MENKIDLLVLDKKKKTVVKKPNIFNSYFSRERSLVLYIYSSYTTSHSDNNTVFPRMKS